MKAASDQHGHPSQNGHRNGEEPDLEIVRRAAELGFDPLRVAAALGVDLRRAAQISAPARPAGSHG